MTGLGMFHDQDSRYGFNMLADIVESESMSGAVLMQANSDYDFEDHNDEDMMAITYVGEALDDSKTYGYRSHYDKNAGIYVYHSAFNNNEVRESLVSVTGIGGSSKAAVNAARVSYGKDSKTPFDNKDRKLLLRLLRDNHGTPLEHNMITYKILIPNPMFKQTLRHRIGVSFNEISGRYSVIKERYYVPLRLRLQNETNHQGSSTKTLSQMDTLTMRGKIIETMKNAQGVYQELLAMGVAKEIARFHLPSSFYTEAYVTFNLRSLVAYLNLRVDDHAQYETREYAKMMACGAYLVFPEFFELALSSESSAFLPGVRSTLLNVLSPLMLGCQVTEGRHIYYNEPHNELGLNKITSKRRDITGHIRMLGN